MNAIVKQDAETGTVLNLIARAASDPNIDIDKMERLLQMRREEQARMAEQEFNAALGRAQAHMGRIAANKVNAQTRSAYADYAALDRVLRPIYGKEELSLSFDTGDGPEGTVRVLCHVSHVGGHTRTYRADMPVDGKGAKGNDVMTKTHAVGSGLSYGMRYLLKMIFNVAIGQDDDDGNRAGSQTVTEEQEVSLREYAEAVGADIPAFLEYMQADSFSSILARDHTKARSALQAKERAAKKAAG